MTRLLPCMGGWCGERERCAYYRLADRTQAPVERLCEPGQDEPLSLPKVQFMPPVWQRAGEVVH